MLQILVVIVAASAAALASAETIGGNPGPQYNYICPNSDNKPAMDCYFDAVGHLYTMCKHVKSIEIIEFGYEHSTEGSNAAKSESCVVKQKLNMAHPYQAALKSATHSTKALEDLRALQKAWLQALAELPWKSGESDEAYKDRTQAPFAVFSENIVKVETDIQLAVLKPAPKHAQKPAAKPVRKAATAKAAH
ncbi:MAG: hypothetical protein ABI190_03165 [Casimicrobiaceae bacterium]